MVEIDDLDHAATEIDGLVVITPRRITDERGTIRELYRTSAFPRVGLPAAGPWAQINLTRTRRGAVRGMHAEEMTKLVMVVAGAVHAAWLDARPNSATRGVVVQRHLEPGVQVLVPPGVCNGFQALEADTEYLYCFDREWSADLPGRAYSPLDEAMGITWPIPFDPDDEAVLSAKDRDLPPFPG